MDRQDNNHVTCVSVWSVRSLYNEDLFLDYISAVQLSVQGQEWSMSLVNCED
jgi:hypothetical protein